LECFNKTWVGLLVISLFSVVSTSQAASSPTFYWHPTSTGLPSSADVEALAINPVTPSTLYAGTFGGGLYRSTDNGQTWVTTTTGITLPISVQGALAVSPFSSMMLYVGDYFGGGLYRSVDSGDHWAQVLPGLSVRAVAFSPLSPTVALVGDRAQGLYRSQDSGDTWSPITASTGLTGTGINVISFAPTAPYTAYVGAGQMVFASRNGGMTWHFKGTLPSAIQAFAVSRNAPRKLLAGTYSHGVYTSTNDGLTWTAANVGLPAGAWVTSLAFDPISTTVVYAGTWDGEVYRSEDNGATWTGQGYLGHVYALAAHPAASGVIYAGTSNNGIFRRSVLHHLNLESLIPPAQTPYQVFTLTLTARDQLNILLDGEPTPITTGSSDPRLATTLSANGYNGVAMMTDATGSITPTQITFTNGQATTLVSLHAEAIANQITVTLPEGVVWKSAMFNVQWAAKVYLPMLQNEGSHSP